MSARRRLIYWAAASDARRRRGVTQRLPLLPASGKCRQADETGLARRRWLLNGSDSVQRCPARAQGVLTDRHGRSLPPDQVDLATSRREAGCSTGAA